jgi:hypothetical protein
MSLTIIVNGALKVNPVAEFMRLLGILRLVSERR